MGNNMKAFAQYDTHKDNGLVQVGDEEFYNDIVTIRGKQYGFLTQKIMLDACASPIATRDKIVKAYIEGINEKIEEDK
jgi:hypothetical protein